MLLVGTESRQLLILDPSGMSIKNTITLKSVPTHFASSGQFDVDHRIYVGCRDGKVYLVRNGEVATEITFAIESRPISMVLFEKQLVIAGMNNTLHSFYLKGKKNFTLTLPAPIIDLAKLEVKRSQTSGSQCVIVALANNEVRLYNPKDKNLIHIMKTEVIKFLI